MTLYIDRSNGHTLDHTGFDEKGRALLVDRSARYPTRIRCAADAHFLEPGQCLSESQMALQLAPQRVRKPILRVIHGIREVGA
jgi:hypothetical protein